MGRKGSNYASSYYEYICKYKRQKSFVLKDLFHPKHEWDFNSESCVFANLERSYKLSDGANQGIYAGVINDEFVVLIYAYGNRSKIVGCETYRSVYDMMYEWQLDSEHLDDEYEPDEPIGVYSEFMRPESQKGD